MEGRVMYSSLSLTIRAGTAQSVQRIGCWLNGPGIESPFSAHVQTALEVHPASCTMVQGLFPGGKAAWAWR